MEDQKKVQKSYQHSVRQNTEIIANIIEKARATNSPVFGPSAKGFETVC